MFHFIEWNLKRSDMFQRILFEALNICDGKFGLLEQLMVDPELSSKTVFDFDWSDPNDRLYKYRSLLVINGLMPGPRDQEMKQIIQQHLVLGHLKNEDEKEIAANFMQRISRIITWNCVGFDWIAPSYPGGLESFKIVDVGSGILRFGSLFNHSCDQNVNRMTVDNKIIFQVNRPIAKGQQLFINYG